MSHVLHWSHVFVGLARRAPEHLRGLGHIHRPPTPETPGGMP
jgi:hypothetical protein